MKYPKYTSFTILKYENYLEWKINRLIKGILYDARSVYNIGILVRTMTLMDFFTNKRSKIPLSNENYIYKNNTPKTNNPKSKYQDRN